MFKRRNMAIIITSLLVFVITLGTMLYHGTKKTVALTLDGKEQVINTHAETIEDLLKELEISISENDYIKPALNTKISENLDVTWKPATEVVITDGEETTSIWTTVETVGELLEEQNIALRDEDVVTPAIDTKLKKDLQVQIERAFEVTVIDGGESKKVWSTSATVADFLKQRGITLEELDRVEPALEDTVTANSTVNVVRVEKVTDVVEEPTNFAVISQKDSSLEKGKEKVVTEGKNGLVSKEYEVIKENGKEVSRSLISEKVVREKQDKVVAIGTKVIAQTVSRGESSTSGREFYVTSTAYTADCSNCSGITATGLNLKNNPNAKVIAVDTSVIPLGTKVYVEGYGYAVAADTGGSIKGNKIDVFVPTKADAYKWGRKQVKIRIVE